MANYPPQYRFSGINIASWSESSTLTMNDVGDVAMEEGCNDDYTLEEKQRFGYPGCKSSREGQHCCSGTGRYLSRGSRPQIDSIGGRY